MLKAALIERSDDGCPISGILSVSSLGRDKLGSVRTGFTELASLKKTVYGLADPVELLLGCDRDTWSICPLHQNHRAGVRVLERLSEPHARENARTKKYVVQSLWHDAYVQISARRVGRTTVKSPPRFRFERAHQSDRPVETRDVNAHQPNPHK